MSKIFQETHEVPLAAELRSLARRAHQVVGAPPDTSGSLAAEVLSVLHQIDLLREQLPEHPQTDLHRWLRRIREMVEARHPAPPPTHSHGRTRRKLAAAGGAA